MDAPPDVAALLSELAERGIQLRLEGEALRFSAPVGALTPGLRGRIQEIKPGVIAHLRAVANAPLPATLSQRRFWQLQRLDPDVAFFNAPFMFRLRGPLRPDLLRRALDAIVKRHESLRTTLHERDGILLQIVSPDGGVDWLEADCRGMPEQQALDVPRHEMLRLYDLAKDPVLRATLVRTAEDTHLLQLCLHNVTFDMASLLVILDELSAHYAALADGREPDLPAPVQYSEYQRWHVARLATGMERRRAYWQDWFAKGEPPAWSWPPRQEPAPQAGFASLPTWTCLTPEEHARLQAFSRSHGVTVYITMLTAYLLATRGLTGAADLTIGTSYSDRDDTRFASMIGAGIVVPALRVDMTDDPGIATLLLRVREVVADALTHQDMPVEEVIPRTTKGPLFKLVCSAFAKTPHGRLRLPGIQSEWLDDWWNPVSRPTLYLIIWETPRPGGAGLTCHMMHRQDVWDEATARAMMHAFELRLRAMALA